MNVRKLCCLSKNSEVEFTIKGEYKTLPNQGFINHNNIIIIIIIIIIITEKKRVFYGLHVSDKILLTKLDF
jgi:hypothetical protein